MTPDERTTIENMAQVIAETFTEESGMAFIFLVTPREPPREGENTFIGTNMPRADLGRVLTELAAAASLELDS